MVIYWQFNLLVVFWSSWRLGFAAEVVNASRPHDIRCGTSGSAWVIRVLPSARSGWVRKVRQ